MLGASSSEEDDDEYGLENDDASDVLGVPKSIPPVIHHQFASTISPRSESPAPSDSVSQANSLKRSGSSQKNRYGNQNHESFRNNLNRHKPSTSTITNRPVPQSSQDISDDDDGYNNDHATPTLHGTESQQKLSKEEQERLRAEEEEEERKRNLQLYVFVAKSEEEEEERKRNLQLYVFVAKCVAYHFNAKQPTDMARRQMKVTKQDLAKMKDRFQAFLRGETQIPADEAFTKAIESYFEVFMKSERVAKVVQAGGFSAHDFREVFRCNVEKRIRSLPEIEGLAKETVLTSWMSKFDLIMKGDDDAIQGRQASIRASVRSRGRLRGANQANADLIQSKDQLYDMFQQILNVKKFEHQIIFNSLQLDNPDEQAAAIRREVATREETLRDMPKLRKIMPKFVVKDMETLFIDEVRQSINLLISNLESVPVTPRGQTISGRKKDSKSRSRFSFKVKRCGQIYRKI
uniref:Calcium-dependent secretion activator n=1 Tax=Panagrolaimus sp. PS1159 TaxID=55785 RepID=A0AC35FFS4_9BILA